MRFLSVAMLAFVFTVPARAEIFESHYSPRIGQHSEIRLTKCIDSTQGSQTPTHECGTFVYDEEIVSRVGDGYRIRYVATAVEGPGGRAALAQLQRLPLDLDTDASGYPVRVENRQALLAGLSQSLPQGDPTALAGTMRTYEAMDDAAFASVVARDFIPLSEFQNIAAAVGETRSQATQSPFPLFPSAILSGSVDFQVERIDPTAGIAQAHYETHYDSASVAHALEAWRQNIMAQQPQPAASEGLRDAHFQLTIRIEGDVDVASGQTKHAHSVRAVDVTLNGQAIHRVETSEIARTISSASR